MGQTFSEARRTNDCMAAWPVMLFIRPQDPHTQQSLTQQPTGKVEQDFFYTDHTIFFKIPFAVNRPMIII